MLRTLHIEIAGEPDRLAAWAIPAHFPKAIGGGREMTQDTETRTYTWALARVGRVGPEGETPNTERDEAFLVLMRGFREEISPRLATFSERLREEALAHLMEQWCRREEGIVVERSALGLMRTSWRRACVHVHTRQTQRRENYESVRTDGSPTHFLEQTLQAFHGDNMLSMELIELEREYPILLACVGQSTDVDTAIAAWIIAHILPLHSARTRSQDATALQQHADLRSGARSMNAIVARAAGPHAPPEKLKRTRDRIHQRLSRMRKRVEETLDNTERVDALGLTEREVSLLHGWLWPRSWPEP